MSTVVYEVNLSINKNTVESFKDWLSEHIAEMLSQKGFLGAKVYECEAPPEQNEKVELAVHYEVDSRENLQFYFDHNAEKMRSQGLQKFAGEFSASRRILNHIS